MKPLKIQNKILTGKQDNCWQKIHWKKIHWKKYLFNYSLNMIMLQNK